MKLSELTERTCEFCGDRFMPKVPVQKYCSTDCRYRQARQAAHEQRVADRAAQHASTTGG